MTTTVLRVLITDDEEDARDKLRRLLSRHVDVTVVGEATNGREAIEKIRSLAPDVVFLDSRMPELDGLEVMNALGAAERVTPKVIFVTAYDEYAVRAFEVRAFDYLLKPFDGARIDAALERVRGQVELEHRPHASALWSMLDRIMQAPEQHASEPPAAPPVETHYLERLCVQSAGRVQVLHVSDVEWIEACGNYARLHTATGRPMMRESLRRLDERLDPARFARIHRCAIVNLDAIRELRPGASGDCIVLLASGMRLRLSRSYRPEVDRRLGRR
jgi:two-component system, LytTR family, response regulator